ncbi:MAG: AMP-binding protein [Candidatus Thiodiazotropha sp. (ex Lucinoma aequizonata)]|nr:AMP-binding protein [Candidatus Thiodiazotropha sp. (ex Lucinoma aequizonata)]MCU7888961.1 AMP-binding protein [Candidatus Thiodiazotropha sp. (ex Lucinoma aequizonata)]MCU7896054.1 AMP-binding protein [Candidatus Thiodiazotropha sp. (ex Lucinoma aequizonata)]MCU7899897.1 AMP-binding protein [Candidatus Thiodiazotropha sp. (ex Lucinoma aequizonata)]MCU7902158.1 AMP-binding protein [Candidatus Thiodiazotropha sp. (ex Lucinoma aequizonata)]
MSDEDVAATIDWRQYGSVVGLLQHRAQKQPNYIAYTYLVNGEVNAGRNDINYAELDLRAKALASRLMAQHLQNTNVLLLILPGIEYLVAFFGCQYAGATAVPAYPLRNKRDDNRIKVIMQDAQPTAVIGTASSMKRARAVDPSFNSKVWIDIEDTAIPTLPWQAPSISSTDVALLQYTSGSTSTPKGVILTHENLLHNSAMTYIGMGHSATSKFVSWLPPYHDMGLIGGILQPLFGGFPCILMAPAAFLQRPYRWLKAISEFRGTTSGAPNFAYDLCVQKVTPEQRRELNLSSWNVAFNGAEPIRNVTHESFTNMFHGCGFKGESFYPCYGLAEASLIVSGGNQAEAPITVAVNSKSLARHRAEEVSDKSMEHTILTSSGHTLLEQDIRIVDPETLVTCDECEIGEIWVSGSSIAKGYLGKEAETAETFHARIAGEPQSRYLRTGDLGFLRNGQLFVTGRLKDLLIINGQNLYPQDIEIVVESSSHALRRHACAAFSVERKGIEQIVVVQELKFRSREDTTEVMLSIRRSVAEAFDVPLAGMVLVKAGSIPITSSGKIKRGATRTRYLDGELRVVDQWFGESPTLETHDISYTVSHHDRTTAPKRAGSAHIRQWLIDKIARVTGLAEHTISPTKPFAEYGLNSVQQIGLLAELETWLGIPIEPTLAWEYPTLTALASFLAGETLGDGTAEPIVPVSNKQEKFIAITGIGCRFPGADNADEYWSLLLGGIDTVSRPENHRLIKESDDDQIPTVRTSAQPGAFLQDIDKFDANFFGITPREAVAMDPQQRFLLEVTWESLEDAGYNVELLAGSNTGVFIGISGSDYALLEYAGQQEVSAYSATGNAHSIAANRISYQFDLQGPSLAVDTACSSSLVAVHLACQSLRNGESSLAIAGGVNIALHDGLFQTFRKSNMLSPEGRCKTFDAAADGYVRGEGCGIVILKPLSKALADNDHIYAVIRGSTINQDGKSNGLTAPNGRSQQDVIRSALSDAGVTPAQVAYVETHGTGTPLGDPIELKALQATLGNQSDETCYLGSVKTNIGHLEAAAGIAGLIKSCLVLKHQVVPKHLHLTEINPKIKLAERFVIPAEATEWSADIPRFAGVSSFGFGGTNAHVVLQSEPDKKQQTSLSNDTGLFTLSAYNSQALRALTKKHIDWLANNPGPLHDVCFTSNVGRKHLPFRTAILASSIEGLRQKLRNVYTADIDAKTGPDVADAGFCEPKIAFLYTGQGAQYPGMTRVLYENQLIFRDAIDKCERILNERHNFSVTELLYDNRQEAEAINRTENTQIALFVSEYALSRLWQSWGIRPAWVMGHSLGEYVAYCIAGGLSLDDALSLVVKRAELMGSLPPGGAMAAIQAEGKQVTEAIDMAGVGLDIAAYNGINTVISGAEKDVQLIIERLRIQGIKTQNLKVSHAFHSRHMEPILERFREFASGLKYAPLRIPLVSNLNGQLLAGSSSPDSRYLHDHIRQPVQFAAGIHTLIDAGCEIIVEIGPKPTLLNMARTLVQDTPIKLVASLQKNSDDQDSLRAGLAQLYRFGCNIDWNAVHGQAGKRIPIPTYAFQRISYWSASPPAQRNEDPISLRLETIVQQLGATASPLADDHLLDADSEQ